MKGRVVSIYLDRRYGWISGEDEHDYRFWARACAGHTFDELPKGIAVEFRPVASRAFDVKPLRPMLPANGEPRQGFVRRLEYGFAVITADDGRTYMARRKDLGFQAFAKLRDGGGVTFETQRSEQGLKARAVVALDC